jgi:chromosome segregation ATPase
MSVNPNIANAAAFQKGRGVYETFDIGFMAEAAAQSSGMDFADLQNKMGKIKTQVAGLTKQISTTQTELQKKTNSLNELSERHSRVKSRYEQRKLQVKEYEKTINALKNGFTTLQDATRVMMENMAETEASNSALDGEPKGGDS